MHVDQENIGCLYMRKEKLKYWVCVYVKGKTKILGVCTC